MGFKIMKAGFLLLFACLSIDSAKVDWSPVDEVIKTAIANGSFPGAVALIASKQGVLHIVSEGNFTYGIPPPLNGGLNPLMQIDTLFDLASCSKVVGATTAVAQFYQRGELNLHEPVVKFLGEDFAQNGKGGITVLNCLLHNAGFPPDPNPIYSDPAFGCPETKKFHPEENFSCASLIWSSLMTQTLENPIGTTYVYSDLSFITLMYVIGALAKNLNYVTESDLLPGCTDDISTPEAFQCYFEAYVRIYVFEELQMLNTGFLPAEDRWQDCAPAENDTTYRHEVIQGQVSDPDAYAMGGIAGHAGIFSNVKDLYILMNRVMFALPDDPIINATTAQFFTTEYNHSQSSRALGWNTNDPTVFDEGWGLLCGDMSAKTFTHVGFSGTQLCGDPERQLITILLTNRVYPTDSNVKIEDVRRKFNSQVVQIFDSFFSST
eukprot:TRINITY_DN4839_c0_g1_i2.p1 TRINITY_DN4839_c0_g1~~TRINITY_DN4839_c0_g1_i2.p1  ORF type:complete len:435 (+),score=45.18 TRINITY_DN4839_c0_g1_i2:65-1369(+)